MTDAVVGLPRLLYMVLHTYQFCSNALYFLDRLIWCVARFILPAPVAYVRTQLFGITGTTLDWLTLINYVPL